MDEATKEGLKEYFAGWLEEMDAWRAAHPKATLLEIEEYARSKRRDLMGRVLAPVIEDAPAETALCPECGGPMADKGRQTRQVETREAPVRVERGYRHCSACGRGLFPLDERLGLCGTFSEGVVRDGALLGSLLPYGQAAESYTQMSGIALSASTLRRLTLREGEQYARALEAEAEAAWEALEAEPADPGGLPFEREAPAEAMNLSMDGTTVNVRGEGWKEVKVAVTSVVSAGDRRTSAGDRRTDEDAPEPSEPTVSLSEPSYRAGLWDARTFERQQWAEGLRRGLDRTVRLSSVNDGARYLWEIVGNCYPGAVEIVDWWHALDHLWKAAQAVYGRGTEEEQAWVAAQKDRLRRSGSEGPALARADPSRHRGLRGVGYLLARGPRDGQGPSYLLHEQPSPNELRRLSRPRAADRERLGGRGRV